MELGVLKIKAVEFVRDFESGMTDHELIRKYSLSAEQLERVFQLLLHVQGIKPVDFEAWQIFHNETVPLKVRLYPRVPLKRQPSIHDATNPQNGGIIVNISQYGFQSKGIRGMLDQMMTLTIPASNFLELGPFTIQARCKWVKVDKADGSHRSGFYVVAVDGTDWESLSACLRSPETETVRNDYSAESEASDVASGDRSNRPEDCRSTEIERPSMGLSGKFRTLFSRSHNTVH